MKLSACMCVSCMCVSCKCNNHILEATNSIIKKPAELQSDLTDCIFFRRKKKTCLFGTETNKCHIKLIFESVFFQ